MENNSKKSSSGKGIYLFFVLMLILLISAAVFISVTGIGKTTTPSLDNTIETQKAKDSEASSDTAADTTAQTKQSESAASLSEEYYMPVSGYISKSFTTEFPVFSVTMNDYRTHNGIDIEAEEGSAVYSCAKGTVSDIYNDPFMGQCVEILHNGDITSRYMSLGDTLSDGIEIGAEVYSGQAIGTVGQSCKIEAADPPHLHFEMAMSGKNINPLDYLGTVSPSDPEYEG